MSDRSIAYQSATVTPNVAIRPAVAARIKLLLEAPILSSLLRLTAPSVFTILAIAGMWALSLSRLDAPPAFAQASCKPALAFTGAHYSPMQLPSLERTWTVAFTVDSSRCAASSGEFSILFSVLTENGPDFEVVEKFSWNSDLNVISRKFWADEAPAAYRVLSIAPCPC